ncbi:hypothetical protein NA56DRAFT_646888 [Hyaloscypha hepaticicola]|uniref:Uncharacterized protein n=1 Tax=Hyaloscypha hepaticicola TaxID=2082293 RepID=A0A2J6Q164_9HELO|nr:hypothetical protein NA56DRAFT_646888 [Hyaloscypha hepaticicola]
MDGTIRPLEGYGREEWARTLDANFRRCGEPYRNPPEADNMVELGRKLLAEYVADPYTPFSLPVFLRRTHILLCDSRDFLWLSLCTTSVQGMVQVW